MEQVEELGSRRKLVGPVEMWKRTLEELLMALLVLYIHTNFVVGDTMVENSRELDIQKHLEPLKQLEDSMVTMLVVDKLDMR